MTSQNRLKPLTHTRSARTRGAYIALVVSILIWFGLGAVQTHWIILALFIIPPSLVAWDLMKNDTAHLQMNDTHLTYGIGREEDRIAFDQIEIMRLNRRLDFSWRITMRLKDGTSCACRRLVCPRWRNSSPRCWRATSKSTEFSSHLPVKRRSAERRNLSTCAPLRPKSLRISAILPWFLEASAPQTCCHPCLDVRSDISASPAPR